MTELQDEKTRQEKTGCLFAFLLSTPILYVLSLGPVVLLYEKCPAQLQKMIEFTYKPLIFAADKVDIVDRILRAYLSLWGL